MLNHANEITFIVKLKRRTSTTILLLDIEYFMYDLFEVNGLCVSSEAPIWME